MKLKLLTVAVAAALSVPVAAFAQGSGGTTTAPSVNQPQGRDTPAGAPAGSQVDPSTMPGSMGNRDRASRSAAGTYHPLDKNRDGYISRDEARGSEWSSRFDSMDKDRDGRLSASEMGADVTGAAGGVTSGSGSSVTSGGATSSGGASTPPASTPSSGGPASVTPGVQGGSPNSPATPKHPTGQ